MNPAVAIIAPVLSRPQNVVPLMASLAQNTTVPHRLLFIASPDEGAEIDALERAGADYVIAPFSCTPGDYARKINLGYELTTEPLIFTAADDIKFHPLWAERATNLMVGRIGVVGTNDMANPRVRAGKHSTHTLVKRSYVEEFGGTWDVPGQVLCPLYHHEFCDEELISVAKVRKAWAFARASLVEHMHPHFGKGAYDGTYPEPNDNPRLEAGRVVFAQRRQMWERQPRTPRPVSRPVRRTSLVGTPPLAKERVQVTVITASLPHRTKQLANALASVAAQTVEVAHLVSVDASVSVAEARNRLITAATTEWVAFLDDDDTLYPHHVTTLLAASEDADVVIPHCDVSGTPLPKGYCNTEFTREDLAAHGCFPVTVLARRSALVAVGGFPVDATWEDHAAWNLLADAGARFKVVASRTWRYNRGRADSRTKALQRAR